VRFHRRVRNFYRSVVLSFLSLSLSLFPSHFHLLLSSEFRAFSGAGRTIARESVAIIINLWRDSPYRGKRGRRLMALPIDHAYPIV